MIGKNLRENNLFGVGFTSGLATAFAILFVFTLGKVDIILSFASAAMTLILGLGSLWKYKQLKS